jgi:hypothetical protein
MSLYISLVLLIFITIEVVQTNAACVPYGGQCSEDCECCGWPDDKAVKCELRNPNRGLRCHLNRGIGEPCDGNTQCSSQLCENGVCINKPRPIKPPQLCPLGITNVDTISGTIPDEEGTCPCPNPPKVTKDDALKAVDGQLSTVYVNNYALDSGLIFHTEYAAPLYNFTICSADTCSECDPTCYKLEGFCEEMVTLTLIQQGDLSFTGRNECVVIPVDTRVLFNYYVLTFPCQRGGFPECSGGQECTCPNGLEPFQPELATKQPCDSSTPITTRRVNYHRMLSDDKVIYASPALSRMAMKDRKFLDSKAAVATISANNSPSNLRKVGSFTRIAQAKHPEISYVSTEKVGDISEIVYKITNIGGFFENYVYSIIQWDGSCCFECFTAYFDMPSNGILDPTDEECSHSCKNKDDLEALLMRTNDPTLCMQGLKLYNPDIMGDKTYFFKVRVHGDVTMVKKPFGMVFGTLQNSVLYGDIESPVCSGCEGGKDSCQNYPMQVAEVSLGAKCKDILTAASSSAEERFLF